MLKYGGEGKASKNIHISFDGLEIETRGNQTGSGTTAAKDTPALISETNPRHEMIPRLAVLLIEIGFAFFNFCICERFRISSMFVKKCCCFCCFIVLLCICNKNSQGSFYDTSISYL